MRRRGVRCGQCGNGAGGRGAVVYDGVPAVTTRPASQSRKSCCLAASPGQIGLCSPVVVFGGAWPPPPKQRKGSRGVLVGVFLLSPPAPPLPPQFPDLTCGLNCELVAPSQNPSVPSCRPVPRDSSVDGRGTAAVSYVTDPATP